MSKVDTTGMSPFSTWWHTHREQMIADDWSCEEIAGAAWAQATASLTAERARADTLAAALEKVWKCAHVFNDFEAKCWAEANAALAAHQQARGEG